MKCMKHKNIIVGQSGGPTAVINSSLAGVFKTARDRGADKIYGMQNGIQGFLEGRYIDLSEHIQTDLHIELLKRTPSAYLGSCRFKLPEIEDNEEMYKKIFKMLNNLEVGYFFYIGGNDSMDTIKQLSKYGEMINSSIRFMGVPKTIDNDLAETDHTPGYGSAAKFIATATKELIRDAKVYGTENIHVVEVMGRNAGWLTASSALSRGEDCVGPDLIYLPEVPFDTDSFLAKVEETRWIKKSIVIAVSEGIKLKDGRYVCELISSQAQFKDSFGHMTLGGTAQYLANTITQNFGCKARAVDLSILQRCSSHMVSRVDITEAFVAGGHAVEAAFRGETGKMIIFNRVTNNPYQCTTMPYDIDKIANIEKKVPLEWLTNDNTYVSPEFLSYARPLIQAELSPIMVDGLPSHLYN
ncbi:MAG: 6-phosphofructokinase [Oscillospiraceae bacterium]|nr:6-phosphofructokinase [Oscillospiraceae bacterium]